MLKIFSITYLYNNIYIQVKYLIKIIIIVLFSHFLNKIHHNGRIYALCKWYKYCGGSSHIYIGIYSCVSVHIIYIFSRTVSLLLSSSTPIGIPPNFPKDRCRRFSRFSRRQRRYNNNNNNMVKWYNTVK